MKRIKNPNRNGRPKVEANKKKDHIIIFRMDSPDFYPLSTKVRESGLCISEYMRQLVKSGEVRQRILPEHNHFIRQLTGMANNLNQLAHKANTFGFAESSVQCKQACNQIDELIKRILQ